MNFVFTALRRVRPEVDYYKMRTDKEVDFIVPLHDRTRFLVQVCEALAEPRRRKRESVALNEAIGELGAKTGIIATRNEEERIVAEGLLGKQRGRSRAKVVFT